PPAPHLSTPSLHDALPIWASCVAARARKTRARRVNHPSTTTPGQTGPGGGYTVSLGRHSRAPHHEATHHRRARQAGRRVALDAPDRKSTRLNSSHVKISYA